MELYGKDLALYAVGVGVFDFADVEEIFDCFEGLLLDEGVLEVLAGGKQGGVAGRFGRTVGRTVGLELYDVLVHFGYFL